MRKTRLDNNMTDHTYAAYDENNTKLSWPIILGADNDENQIGQLCDWLYRYCDRLD